MPQSDPSFLNKPADTPKPETEPKPETSQTPDAPKAPDKYADFTVPDGFKFDDKTLEGAIAVFKDLNLPQDGAQKLVDFYTKNLQEAQQAPYKAWSETQDTWRKEIGSRFGGDEAAARVSANINKAIDASLPPSLARSFRTALDITGAGSNPDIVEALSIALRPHFEGTPVRPGSQSPEANARPGSREPISAADAMYPHLRK